MSHARRILAPICLSILCAVAGSPAALAWGSQESALGAAEASPDAERIRALIETGRAHLAARRAEEALALFDEAAELDEQRERTRIWVYRTWLELGRCNDSLDAIDAIAPGSVSEAARDYLYGMAFVRRAEQYIAAGVTDASVQMNFEDANVHLTRALESEPERFEDAYLSLAKAAWFTQNLASARRAAERAVEVQRSDPRCWHQLGHVALSQFVTEQKAVPPGSAAEAHWESACAAFARAVAYFGRPLNDPEAQTWLADAATQLGHARMWKKDNSSAADAYAVALAWAPQTFDYGTVYGLLTRPTAEAPALSSIVFFHRAVEEGARRFSESFGAEDPRDATLLWWLGWSRFHAGDHRGSEQAFAKCLAKNPDLLNGWVFLALARYELGDFAGSASALSSGWGREPAIVLTELKNDLETNAHRLAILIDETYTAGDLATAAFLAEVSAEVRETDAAQWNNLGFFLCERSKALRADTSVVPADGVLEDLGQRALAAYERALELTPDDPRILNDAAVILQHHLGRDLERARALYVRALALSRSALSAPDLSDGERQFHEAVVSDAEANLSELGE